MWAVSTSTGETARSAAANRPARRPSNRLPSTYTRPTLRTPKAAVIPRATAVASGGASLAEGSARKASANRSRASPGYS